MRLCLDKAAALRDGKECERWCVCVCGSEGYLHLKVLEVLLLVRYTLHVLFLAPPAL